jgi:leucyl/phenylalanyl-tRNA--protein transferase
MLAKPVPVGPSRWRIPPVSEWPADDLVSAGGDLEASTLIDGYRHGLFPMEISGLPGVLGWWSPNPRGILPLDRPRASRSLLRSARRFEVRINTSFDRVIRACANPDRPDGWITGEFIAAYSRLHALGWAHSVEVFDAGGQLAGGLYGVRVEGLFSGESMFHHQRDASKVALLALVDFMRAEGMTLLDVQWCTDHLASLGAVAVPREEYLARLAEAMAAAPAAPGGALTPRS